MSSMTKVIVFAAVLSVLSAALLTGMKVFTGDLQEENKLAYKRKNILKVLDISVPRKVTAEEINKLYDDNVKSTNYKGIEVFQLIKDGSVVSQAVEFEGAGLWNKIKGYLALDADMKTIKGITFYEHEETPGLGGEIDAKWFQDQFVGKPLTDENGNLAISIVKAGTAEKANDIDGISGATITGTKVQDMLADLCRRMK